MSSKKLRTQRAREYRFSIDESGVFALSKPARNDGGGIEGIAQSDLFAEALRRVNSISHGKDASKTISRDTLQFHA